MQAQYSQYTPEEINLQKYLQVLQRRWLVATGVLVSSAGAAAFVASRLSPVYTAEGQLLFQGNMTSDLTGVGEQLGSLKAVNTQSSPLSTQAVILKSPPIMQKVIQSLKLKDEEGKPLKPEALAESLKVEPVTGTDILQLTYNSDNREEAAAILNEVIKIYRNNNREANRKQAKAALDFIETQLPLSEKEVDQAAEVLRAFRAKNQIIDFSKESEALVELLSKLDAEINTTQGELVDLTAKSGAIRQQMQVSPQQAIALNSLNQATGVQEVLKDLQTVQRQLATVRTVYTDKSYQVQSLARQANSLQTLLQQRVTQVVGPSLRVQVGDLQMGGIKNELAGQLVATEVSRLGMQQKLASLINVRQAYRQQSQVLPTLEKRQQELERKLGAAKTAYEKLLENFQEARIAANQIVSNTEVVQWAAVPEIADSKLRNLMTGGGIFVGLSLGIAAAFFVDLIDRSVKSVGEAKALFGYTLIGLIPRYETLGGNRRQDQEGDGVSPRILQANAPRSPIQESYQMLRANLSFVSSDQPLQTLVITSSVPGEGKSEVSANLAAAIAQVGRRVLLVDADMRSPSQHHLWGLINQIGLSNVIVGQETPENAIQAVTSRLSVMTAGVIPPNPLALLDSERMSRLVGQLASKYDYIIFDTPPLAGIADAAVLGRMVDGMLLVVQPGVVNSASANAAKALIERSEPNVIGIVANGINMKHEPGSYFYYSSEQNYRDRDKAGEAKSSNRWASVVGGRR